jgi:hypothetical protein
LLGDGIDHVADHDHGWRLGEGVEQVRRRVGYEEHVALVNGGPSANGGAVHAEAFLKRALGQLVDWVRNVVLQARQISEAEIEHFDAVLLHEFHNAFRISWFLIGHKFSLVNYPDALV